MGQFYKAGIPACRLLIRCELIAYICCILNGGVALHMNCPRDWTPCPQSGTCIQAVLVKKTWHEARQDCLQRGSDLVKILDSKMDHWLWKLMWAYKNRKAKSLSFFYIGLLKRFQEDAYHWLNETYEAKYIGDGSLDFSEEQLCAMISLKSADRPVWFYISCTFHASYVCEKIPVKLCPDDFYPNSDAGTCIKLVRQPMSWHNARAHCQTLGGDLAVVLDDKVDQFLSDQTVGLGDGLIKSVWIGLNDIGSRGNFKWLDNFVDGVRYTNWNRNHPDSQNKSNCVELSLPIVSKPPIWDDTDCNKNTYFICEKFADCQYKKYGMFCPKSCISALCADDQAACNRRNGICQNACSNNRYGVGCLKACSPHCGGPDKACHLKDGSCLSGCEDGYKGVKCETECANHSYGKNCSKTCSPHCGGQTKTCDHRDGSCLSGCAGRYTGLLCETECTNRTYGENCSKTCSPHCGGQTKTCDHKDGSCLSGCANGYTGLRCERECANHTYGEKCLKTCSPHCGGQTKTCDHRDGSCLSGCADGYTGLRCDRECANHTYGENCLKTCSPHCGGQNNTCDHRDGSCLSGCADGYTGLLCERECANHTYGENCLNTCSPHCGGQTKTCDHRDGSCLSGCADGYTGLRCDRAVITYSTLAIVAAALFAGVVLLICILPTTFIHSRRRKTGSNLSVITEDQDLGQEEQMEPDMEDYDEELDSILGDMMPKTFWEKRKHRFDDDYSHYDTSSGVGSIASTNFSDWWSRVSPTYSSRYS